METRIILKERDDGVVEIHLEGDVEFVGGWDLPVDLLWQHDVEIITNSNEFEKMKEEDKKDNSWEQIKQIAKEDRGLFLLDNGIYVTADWCKGYIKAIDSWLEWETEQLAGRTGAGSIEVKQKKSK